MAGRSEVDGSVMRGVTALFVLPVKFVQLPKPVFNSVHLFGESSPLVFED